MPCTIEFRPSNLNSFHATHKQLVPNIKPSVLNIAVYGDNGYID